MRPHAAHFLVTCSMITANGIPDMMHEWWVPLDYSAGQGTDPSMPIGQDLACKNRNLECHRPTEQSQ